MKTLRNFYFGIISKHKYLIFSGVSLVFLASGVANLANYLYTVLVGRLLGPSSYGLLAVIMSLLSIMSVPGLALNTVCAKFAAQFKAQNIPQESWSLMLRLSKRVLQSGLLVFMLVFIFSPFLTKFLNLPSPIYLWWLMILLISSFLLVIPTSLIQGLQLFTQLAIAIILGGALKLFLGVLFVKLSWGVSGALLGMFLSVLLVLAFVIYVLHKWKIPSSSISLSRNDLLRFATPTLLTYLGLTIINYQDLVIVRRFFPPVEVGMYAALSTLGKIIFFGISTVMTVAFPIIAESFEKKAKTNMKIFLTLITSLGLAVVTVFAYFMRPILFVKLLFGNEYLAISPMLGLMGILVSIYSINYVITMILLAKHQTQVWLICIILASLHTGLLLRFHDSLLTIMMMGILANCLLLSLLTLYYSSDSQLIRKFYAILSKPSK